MVFPVKLIVCVPEILVVVSFPVITSVDVSFTSLILQPESMLQLYFTALKLQEKEALVTRLLFLIY